MLEKTDDRICPACGYKFKDSDKLLRCPGCGKQFEVKEEAEKQTGENYPNEESK